MAARPNPLSDSGQMDLDASGPNVNEHYFKASFNGSGILHHL